MKTRTRKPATILPPYLPVEKIQEDIYNGSQSIEFLGIYKLYDALEFNGETMLKKRSVKIRIHIDRDSYDTQSSATIQSWTGTGWTLVTEIPFKSCESHDVFYQTKASEIHEADTHRFSIDAENLIGLAARILF